MMLKSGIYLLTNTITGERYVGSSKNLKRREHCHFYDLKRGKHSNPILQHAYNKYGLEAFHFEILQYCEVADLIGSEKWWVDLLGTMHPAGYNLLSPDRHECSEATRKKISDTCKRNGNKPPSWKGRKCSPEMIEARREKMIGHDVSSHTRRKISESLTGRPSGSSTKFSVGQVPWNVGLPMASEQLELLRAIHTGRKLSEDEINRRSKSWSFLNPEGEEVVIRNLAAFCRENGLNQGHMWSVSAGKAKQHKGWKRAGSDPGHKGG